MADTAPIRWQPARKEEAPSWPVPPLLPAMWRGAQGKCPACGVGKLFRGYLKVCESCRECSAPLGLARADDAPPYFTILLVGHIMIGPMLWLERAYAPALWLQTALWVPIALALTLGLLRPVKGATVGLMTAYNMLKPGFRE